jgi:hypothetical protein
MLRSHRTLLPRDRAATCCTVLAVVVLILMLLAADSTPPQDTFNIKELAEYRLSVPAFARFAAASRLIAAAVRDDPRLAANPLFTRDVSLLDDVRAAAEKVEAQLKFEPRYVAALRIASVSPREYTKFALALFGARLAHGFLKSGAMRHVPAGVASDNVAFIEAHEAEVAAILRLLELED